MDATQSDSVKVIEDSMDVSDEEGCLDESIPESVLIELLPFVAAEDLVFNCRLVCKQWKDMIDAQSVWRRKCEREHVKLPTHKLLELPRHYYRYIYWHAKDKRKNLLKNPCGESKLDNWKIIYEGDFIIENPPVGASPVPTVVGSQSCFASSYNLCAKYQEISIAENPVHSYLLQHNIVTVKVGEWYCARRDSAAKYELKVILYDQDYDVIDKFEFKYVEKQWCGIEWHLVTHEFTNVTNAHIVAFQHQGTLPPDCKFRKGYYGSKMTGAFVELCIK